MTLGQEVSVVGLTLCVIVILMVCAYGRLIGHIQYHQKLLNDRCDKLKEADEKLTDSLAANYRTVDNTFRIQSERITHQAGIIQDLHKKIVDHCAFNTETRAVLEQQAKRITELEDQITEQGLFESDKIDQKINLLLPPGVVFDFVPEEPERTEVIPAKEAYWKLIKKPKGRILADHAEPETVSFDVEFLGYPAGTVFSFEIVLERDGVTAVRLVPRITNGTRHSTARAV